MAFETILCETSDEVLTITLNRPDKLNAYTLDMGRELIAAFDRADADDSVRAIIMTGAGRAFCAGADLAAGGVTFDRMARRDRPTPPTLPDGAPNLGDEAARDSGGRVTLRIFSSLKPVIAAVNGPAVGIGVTMLLPADIRIASIDARFGFVFVRRGIVPEACSSWFLPRIVGIAKALEWSFSGRVFPAEEALAGGLVSAVHPPAALMPAARAIAREIAGNTAPVSVALTRQMMWGMLGADHPMEAHKIDSRGMFTRGASADVREGVTAFLEKRAPKFSDRVSRDMPAFFPWARERPYQ